MKLDTSQATALAVATAVVATMLKPWTASAQSTFESLRYNERGQLAGQQVNGTAVNHRYDRMDRLVEQSSPSLQAGTTQRYVLDADGNRLADSRSSYMIQPGAQRVAARDGAPLVHGPAGHLLADRVWGNNRWVQRNFSWNTAGQLKSVTLDGVSVASYLYNDAGQRTRKTLAAAPAGVPAVTLYRYDPLGQLVLEVAGAPVQAPGVAVAPGQVLVRYVWQDDMPVAVIWPPMTPDNPGASSERLVHLIVDHLNTPRRALDSQGVVVWKWQGEAFGADLPDDDVDRDGRRTVINLRFPGQYFDAESRLHYNWHRYYDPQVGRYIQSDPFGLQGGINTYAYVGGNPLSRVDPEGLYWFQQEWQARDPIVGRQNTFVPPGGPISSFVEKYVPAGRTLAEIHDPMVDMFTGWGLPDPLVNITTMPSAYASAIVLEILRSLGIAKQPSPPNMCPR